MNNDQRDDKLTEIHTAVTVLVKELQEVRVTIYGNGKPGLKLDVDRLKVFKIVSCWFFGAIIIASITVVGKLVYNSIVT